ncbi:MAG: hypothetical protein O3B47_03970, partial [bacterium]|nr:hypothetical protein [bacterium]
MAEETQPDSNVPQAVVAPSVATADIDDKVALVKAKLAQKSLRKGSIAAKAINTIVYALIAGAVITGNYFVEAKYVDQEIIEAKGFTEISYEETNILPKNRILRFDPEWKDSSMEIVPMDNEDYLLYLNSGHIWGNFSISNANTNIFVENRIIVIPVFATFDLSFDGERMILDVYDGNVYLAFWHEDKGDLRKSPVVFEKYFADGINNLLVPRGNHVDIPLKKIDEDIEPLLFSKLAKEFKYSAIPSASQEQDWVTGNMKDDTKYIESVKQEILSGVLSKGVQVSDGIINRAFFWSEENLTFVPEKKAQMISVHNQAYLDDALYYVSQGDETKAQESLSKFSSLGLDVPSFYEDIITVFNRADKQSLISDYLINKSFSEADVLGSYMLMDKLWSDVYSGMDESTTLAELSLDNYYKRFDQLLGDVSGKDQYRMYLTFQNQLFDNLLLRNSIFYADGYFAMKNVIEQELLEQYEGQLKDELKQTFISYKIDFMKRMRKHFFNEEIEVPAAKEIFARLFEEVDALMPADTSSVAVIELFQDQLNDIDDLWGYLNSPEYHTGSYGLTHEKRYESYLTERDTIYSLIDLTEDVLGETVEVEEDTLSVIKEVEELINANEDISDLEVGEIKEKDQRYVSVKAVLGGYPFEAQYDRDTDVFNEVYVYEELISDYPVKLDSLLSVLQDKFADLAEDLEYAEGEDKLTEETSAQRFARVYIAKKVGEFGFEADLENVSIVDELNAIYRLENVFLKDVKNIEVTFDILMNGELTTNVLLMIDGKPTVLDGKYTLEELAIMVAGGDFSEEEEEK